MALPTPLQLLEPPHISMKMASKVPSSGFRFKGWSANSRYFLSTSLVFQPLYFRHPRHAIRSSMNMVASDSGDSKKIKLDQAIGEIRKVWESFPEPIKIFPWKKAFVNYVQLIVGIIYGVAKFLCIPLLAVSSLSEMSYCAHEQKMTLIPLPLLAGIFVAGVLKEASVEVSKDLQEGDFPWHLVAIGAFFTLLKLLGPYYPYWGRILIPHFANGGLWRTLWFVRLWYSSTEGKTKTTSEIS
ncbi:uncharacterized protein LOC18442449 [Amborella trichopoda]|uniref:Embryo defective 1273 n=1 Tax=Amborella trichopoda TaxID=13333 RepID=U5CVQ3_AMBTC|nr:uncharacterized protein LOC18442449 [Amborella trichopoda]ERN14194.1 hypothetical protein AMTR_s00033p00075910 [Amborella trichopoda]|eukprot:XP_006852727.1 uncharacterized protein LOC18442449 [Amborella trichopoda]